MQTTPFPNLTSDNGVVSEDREKANFIVETFATASKSSNFPPSFVPITSALIPTNADNYDLSSRNNDPLGNAFTMAELRFALASRKNSAPG